MPVTEVCYKVRRKYDACLLTLGVGADADNVIGIDTDIGVKADIGVKTDIGVKRPTGSPWDGRRLIRGVLGAECPSAAWCPRCKGACGSLLKSFWPLALFGPWVPWALRPYRPWGLPGSGPRAQPKSYETRGSNGSLGPPLGLYRPWSSLALGAL